MKLLVLLNFWKLFSLQKGNAILKRFTFARLAHFSCSEGRRNYLLSGRVSLKIKTAEQYYFIARSLAQSIMLTKRKLQNFKSITELQQMFHACHHSKSLYALTVKKTVTSTTDNFLAYFHNTSFFLEQHLSMG